jgi:hypothetical protein
MDCLHNSPGINLMNMRNIRISLLAFFIVSLYSCSTPPKTEKEIVLQKPETVIQIASINLSGFNKRMERKSINDLVTILKQEQVEVLAVQGVSRYPGVAARIDFINELSAKTDWRNVFGEMLNISGRQTGNAIFSVYPILSHQNISWDGVRSKSFDAALQATVDAGARSLIVVSTQLPPKASVHEQEQCATLIAAMNPDTARQFMIVSGNMPSDESIRTMHSFAEVSQPESTKGTASKIWYSATVSLQLLASRSVETDLGTLVIAQFGFMRQEKH